MTSKLACLSRLAAISATSGAMLPASLRTGTTTQTAGGAIGGVSLISSVRGSVAAGRALWGDQLAGNPLEAIQRGPRHRANASILAASEDQAAARKPRPHQQDHGACEN